MLPRKLNTILCNCKTKFLKLSGLPWFSVQMILTIEIKFIGVIFFSNTLKIFFDIHVHLSLLFLQVIYNLKKKCGELSEEELGKLSVQLLNCQSEAEDRPVFPCTHSMVNKIKSFKKTVNMIITCNFQIPNFI